MKLISGLTYIEDFLTRVDEQSLLAEIDGSPWLDDLKRRVQHYGYKYDYRARAIDETMFLGALPGWAMHLGKALVERNLFPEIPDQVIVNEYMPGQGISAHVDCEPCFKDTIGSVTLGSGCAMEFTSIQTLERRQVYLHPRSVVILSGEARHDWKHAIAARKSDVVGNNRVPRDRRVSLTYRNVLLGTENAF